ncbi:hypothetical protein BT96DRAFT_825151, partial [Gymnopus androsaceus JB14]
EKIQSLQALYRDLVEKCFRSCCADFACKAMTSKEETCVINCVDKFLDKSSKHPESRFAE